MPRDMLEHPDITHALRTGYPSWIRDPDGNGDEDDFRDDDDDMEDWFE